MSVWVIFASISNIIWYFSIYCFILVQFKINEGSGLPSFFTTGSCAEFHFKPLRRLLGLYLHQTTGTDVDLGDKSKLFQVLQSNTHIVAKYFDLRTKSYFSNIMALVFGVNSYWYRQEFAKSRGMVHWHGLCWREDREPHNLLHKAIEDGLSGGESAERLAKWASSEFGLTASHPAGKDENGESRKNLWPPPEGSAPAPPEEKNPLVKLLMDISASQESLLEDHLLLTNRINLHRCSDYCLKPPKSKRSSEKVCRMEFGSPSSPGKPCRTTPELVKDKNGSLRLEMARDHPMMVQHSRFHTQGWRANGDISLILSQSAPDNPSVDEIIATEKYITGYACKGNQPIGAVVELFNDMVNCADESSEASGKSIVTKLLMSTVKRDISAVEASYELSSLPLYRSSHTFAYISLSGSRLLECSGSRVTKNNAIDRYLWRSENDTSSLYRFTCSGGRVPVISGTYTEASWPLSEDYCRAMLLLHWPNWRNIRDIKDENTTWIEKMTEFFTSEDCPNFVKADVERAKKHKAHEEQNDELNSDDNQESSNEKPEWMEVIQPNPSFDFCTDFNFDDGGPDHDWSETSHEYPQNMGYSGNDCNHGRKAAALPTRVLNELFTNNMAPAGESYGSWTLARLKAELRKRGAKTSGRKHELVKR